MTSLSYEDIFSNFLGRITDFKLLSLPDNQANAVMTEYLHKSVAQPYVDRLFSTRSYDNDGFNFELAYPTNENSDSDFILNVIGMGMVVAWLKPQVRSMVNTAQLLTGAEQKFYSQANHLSELRALLQDSEIELRGYIRDRGYIHNDYLNGI